MRARGDGCDRESVVASPLATLIIGIRATTLSALASQEKDVGGGQPPRPSLTGQGGLSHPENFTCGPEFAEESSGKSCPPSSRTASRPGGRPAARIGRHR